MCVNESFCIEVRVLSWDRRPATWSFFLFFFTLVAGPRRSLRLKLSDTKVYEPHIRARLGNHNTTILGRPATWSPYRLLHGYLAHKKTPPRRTVRRIPSALWRSLGAWQFLMGEVPLYAARPPYPKPSRLLSRGLRGLRVVCTTRLNRVNHGSVETPRVVLGGLRSRPIWCVRILIEKHPPHPPLSRPLRVPCS